MNINIPRIQMPLSFGVNRENVSIQWKGWTRPDINDESAWHTWDDGGGSMGNFWAWGEGGHQGFITDTQRQLMYHKSWVYVVNNYNAKQMTRQKLRLYSQKEKGAPAFKNVATQGISPAKDKYLRDNPGLEKWVTQKDIEIVEVLEHPFLDIMKAVNPILNSALLWMLTETFMGLTGNAFWWIRRNALDVPYQIWLLEPQYVTPLIGRVIDEYIRGYVYRVGTNRLLFDPDEIIHFKYPNPHSQILGLSPVLALSDQVRIDDRIAKYSQGIFKNMARPDGALEMEPELSQTQFEQIKRQWNQVYGGVSEAGKVAILHGGAKYKAISMKPRDLDYLKGGEAIKEIIANGFGVPVPLISPQTNKANSEISYHQYMRDTIAPKNTLYQQTINEVFISIYPEDKIFAAFDDCVPEDKVFALKEKESDLKTGYSVINEIRKEEGKEPHKDWGDVPIMPTSMVEFGSQPPPGANPSNPPKPAPKSKEDEKRALELLDILADKIVDKLIE